MKNYILTLAAMLCSFFAGAQCFPGIILGSPSVAVGHSITLRDTANWYSTGLAAVYNNSGTWSSGNSAIATVNPSTGVVTGRSQGTVTITFTLDVPCASVATTTISVTSGLSGRLRICVGDTATLRDTLGTGTWSSSNPSIASINSATGLVSGVSAGVSVITFTGTVAGLPATLHDTVRVANITSIGSLTGPAALCPYDTAIISCTAGPVSWRTSDGLLLNIYSAGDNSMITEAAGPGVARIIASSVYCPQIADSVTITIHPRPDAGEIAPNTAEICQGTSLTLTLIGGDGFPGYWSTASGYVATISASGVLTGLNEGWESAVYTVMSPYGCIGSTYNYITVDIPPYLYGYVAPSSIALGQTATLSGSAIPNTTGAYSTYWSCTPTSIASTTPTGTLTGLAIGNAEITFTGVNSCGVNFMSSNLTVTAPPFWGSCSSFTAFTNVDCSAPVFGVSVPAHSTPYQLKTSFGDGDPVLSTTILPSTSAAVTTFPYSGYPASGYYSVKQVLYSGATPIDSVEYTYHHMLCRDFSLTFYVDSNSNCTYDSAEQANFSLIKIEVARNGAVVDTIPATSGLYYHTLSVPGDVYAFRIIQMEPGLVVTCPASGIVYDTVSSSSVISKSVGLRCSSASVYDFSVSTSFRAGRHMASGVINVTSNGCSPLAPSVTMAFDPHYLFMGSDPAPSSIVGNVVTWNFPVFSASDVSTINFTLDINGLTWLLPGTPIFDTFSVTPITGDVDLSNNVVVRVDTVKSSYDPNHITVQPAGGILNGTKLHYAVAFENDGNDTAHNIYVLDTLSDNLLPSSLAIESSSSEMNTTVLHSGAHTILRFEFPHIMLPDSSHHNQCTGMFSYSIKTKTGLADGTDILGHVGIYFDDNEVVLTDTAFNKIVIPAVTIASGVSDSICDGIPVHFMATPHSVNTPHYVWSVNSVAAGSDSVGFTLPVAHISDTIQCVMTTTMDQTVYSTSNRIILQPGGAPSTGVISGLSSVCIGANITLTETVAGGTWSVTNTHATIAGGVIHGVTSGQDTVVYTVTNVCGTAHATYPVTVSPLPDAGAVTGSSVVCIGSPVTLSSSAAGGAWSLTNGHASHTGAVISGVSAGTDTVVYTVTTVCGTASVNHVINIGSPVATSVTMSSAPGTTVCAGDTVIFTPLPVNGGTAPVYHWKRFGNIMGTGSTFAYVPSLGDVVTCTMLSSALCPIEDSVTTAGSAMTVYPVVTPTNVISTPGGDTVTTAGQMVTFYSSTTYCGSSASYQWYVNGVAVPGATASSYTATIDATQTVYSIIDCSMPCATSSTDTSNAITVYLDVDNVGQINHSGINGALLIPNPGKGSFVFSGNIHIVGMNTSVYQVLDMTGKVVMSGDLAVANGLVKQQIDLPENTASGNYILRIVTGQGVGIFKFTVEK